MPFEDPNSRIMLPVNARTAAAGFLLVLLCGVRYEVELMERRREIMSGKSKLVWPVITLLLLGMTAAAGLLLVESP